MPHPFKNWGFLLFEVNGNVKVITHRLEHY